MVEFFRVSQKNLSYLFHRRFVLRSTCIQERVRLRTEIYEDEQLRV